MTESDTESVSCRSDWLAYGAVFLLAFVPAGCTGSGDDLPPRATVSGTVTFEGQPVKAGIVQFTPVDDTGRAAGARIEQGGSYTLEEDVPVGRYRVVVRPPMPSGPGAPVPEAADIPEKYRSDEETDLTVEVKEGTNSIELPMKAG